jgi:hypothetical protein
MMSITRGTTPNLVVTISGIDLTTCDSLYLTFKQDRPFLVELTKTKNDMEVSSDTLSVSFSQEETLRFDDREDVLVQLRGTMNGKAFASDIQKMSVDAILKNGVIE